MGRYIPEYDVSTEELNTFIDMFELWPVYTALFEIPELRLSICTDGEIITHTCI